MNQNYTANQTGPQSAQAASKSRLIANAKPLSVSTYSSFDLPTDLELVSE